jgi:hypothetical protein
MMVWDLVNKTHEVLAHTGFVSPHSEQHYSDGELRLPNEIDRPLITLGGTVDAAFRAALAAAFDPLGNLDQDQNVIGNGHSVSDDNYPYYPVLRYLSDGSIDGWEYHRPWAWPDKSRAQVGGGPEKNDTTINTPPETYNPFASFNEGPDTAYKPLRPGPYPLNTMPDVFFRLDAPVDLEARAKYERAQTPWQTDILNAHYLHPNTLKYSPLGDPIPFSAHLIGQLANNTGFSTQFNLDSDRAFAYLTWDWVRNDPNTQGGTATGILGLTFTTPKEPPEGETDNPAGNVNPFATDKSIWRKGTYPLLLQYVDPPGVQKPPDIH